MAQKKPSWKKIIISPVCQNDLTRATESQEKQESQALLWPECSSQQPTDRCADTEM